MQGRPQPPKRPLASFFLFKKEIYEAVKKDNPDCKITELTKIIAEKWKNVDEKTKKGYENLHLENKKKYEVERQAYEN